MPRKARADSNGQKRTRTRKGQGKKQARGASRKKAAGWPPRWLTPVPAADIRNGDGKFVAEFIEANCLIPEDSFAGARGEPFKLRSWQREAVDGIYARVGKKGPRRHRLAVYATARKNGKSALAASLALGALMTEQNGGQVISAAADQKQASIIWAHARRMVELSPELTEEIAVFKGVSMLEHKPSGSTYKAVSSEAYTKEGLSPTFVICDELHAFPNRELFDVLHLSLGARRDPLMLIVTTAGVMSTRTEDESVLYQLYNHGLAVIRGEVEDPTFFMAWWGAEEEADHRDEKVWQIANPGLGDIVDLEDMRSAIRITPESEFRIKRTNLFVPTEDFWLPAGAWDDCINLADELDPALPVAVGIDIGIVHDASAVMVAQQQHENKVVVRGRYWINPHRPGTVMHEEWRLPLDELLQHIRDLHGEFPVSAVKIDGRSVPGPAYVYDRYGLASAELTLEGEHGFALIPIPQQGGWMIEASRRFYEGVLEGRISHDGDETLASHLRNVVPRQVGESGWRLEKASRSKKIDGAVAAVMAVSQAMEAAPRARFRAFAA